MTRRRSFVVLARTLGPLCLILLARTQPQQQVTP